MKSSLSVPELDNQLKSVVKYSLYILAGVCLFLVFYPRDGVVWGIFAGILTGIYNAVVSAGRIKRLPTLSREAGNKHIKKGMVLRLVFIMAVLFLISTRLPFISLCGVGAGILIPTAVSTVISLVDTYKLYKRSMPRVKKNYN